VWNILSGPKRILKLIYRCTSLACNNMCLAYGSRNVYAYQSKGCNICKMVFYECYINDATCSGVLGHCTSLVIFISGVLVHCTSLVIFISGMPPPTTKNFYNSVCQVFENVNWTKWYLLKLVETLHTR
jgi:hypothetical protein